MIINYKGMQERKVGFWGLFLLTILQVSCKKFIEVSPPGNSTNAANVYTDNSTAAAVLTGIYVNLSKGNSGGFSNGDFTSLSLFPALAADELTLYDPNMFNYFVFYSNSLSASPATSTANYWGTIYPYIFVANSAIEGLNKSTSLTPEIKQQLLGEAKFVRSLFYFYLVNLYGDVPMVLSSDWQANAKLVRVPVSQVYDLIISDLKEAKEGLSNNYLNADALSLSNDRVRPTKWAASALLARVYLYIGDFSNAVAESSRIIDNNSLFKLVALNEVFLKNSKEAIWQIQAVGTGTSSNTGEGKLFILPSKGPGTANPVYLSNNLLNSFEPGDQRKINWVSSVTPTPGTTTYYFPNKYKVGLVNSSASEYSTVFRLSEQYLIRAEARAQLNNISGSVADLDTVRKRANLPLISNTNPNISQSALIDKIIHEKQIELFTEWGHRWFDLKRTNRIDDVMKIITPLKGGTWEADDKLFPIPQTELDKAPQLRQNPGYQ